MLKTEYEIKRSFSKRFEITREALWCIVDYKLNIKAADINAWNDGADSLNDAREERYLDEWLEEHYEKLILYPIMHMIDDKIIGKWYGEYLMACKQ